jgi:hypothetical protein
MPPTDPYNPAQYNEDYRDTFGAYGQQSAMGGNRRAGAENTLNDGFAAPSIGAAPTYRQAPLYNPGRVNQQANNANVGLTGA